jgi:hypothetical protein
MIKNLFYVATVLGILALGINMLLAADLREEAWRCDRLVRQGYPTGQNCEDLRADAAQLPDQRGYMVALIVGAGILGIAAALDLRAEARKERARKDLYRRAANAAEWRMAEMNLVGFVERRNN